MTRYLLAAASLPVLALAAHAQQGQDEDTVFVAETVIVTLPGPDRSADELIGNATALEREEILERLTSSLGDTLSREPGVSSTFFGQGASRPVLRGLGAERVQVLTNGLGVIDASAASPDHQVTADGIDAEKIEILRGPAALAYGGQAIGGVVNVIDGLIAETVPEDPLSADLFGAWNSVNEGTELAARGQFVSGPLVATLSASQRDFDDYDIPGFAESDRLRAMEEHGHDEEEDHDHDEEHEDEEVRDTLENSFVETETLAGGLSLIGDRGFVGVAVRHQASEYGLPGHSHAHEEEEHGEEDEDHDEDHEHEHDHEEEAAFIDLEQTRIDLRGGLTFETGPFTRVNASLALVDYEHTEFEGPGEPGTIFETEGYEGRIEADYGRPENGGAIGLQVVDKELVAEGEEAFITPTDTSSLGLFAYHAMERASGFGVEAGGRIERVEVENQAGGGSREFDLVSASAGVHQHFGDGWFVGTSLAYTERAPSDVELFADGPHLATSQFEVGAPDLDVETGINLEASARWTGETLSFGANLFASDFDGFIFLTPGVTMDDGETVDEADGLPVFVYTQRDVVFLGGELYGALNLEGPLGADWEFDAGLDFVNANLSGGPDELPRIPPVTFNAGAAAEWGAFEVGARVTAAGEQDEAGAGELPTDSYTLLDLRAEVDLSDFGIGADGTEAFIEARNVTDEEARIATSVLKDRVPLPGRNIRIGIRAAF